MSTTRAIDGELDRSGNSSARTARWILILALAVALVRFVRLAHWSLWVDESLTWTDWHVGLEGGEIHNPAGYALVAAAVRILGGVPDEFALRIGPAIAGFLCIPFTWLAFRRFAGEMRAACAALLLAASSWHVYWSQNARFYTCAQLAGLVGTWLYLRGLERGSTMRAVLGLIVVAGGAAFHPSVALLLPALVVAPLVLARLGLPLDESGRRVAKRMLVAGCVVALLGSKWTFDTARTYYYQKQIQAEGGAFSLSAVVESLAHYAKTTGFFVTPLIGAGLLFGVWFAWKRREREVVFVAVVVLACVACGFAAAAVARISAQYVFFALPWIMLLASSVLARGDSATENERTAGLTGSAACAYMTLLFVPSLVTTGLYLTVRQGERPQWREAYQFVWNERQDGDLVLGMHATVGEYYVSPRNVDLRHPAQIGWLDAYHAHEPETWSKYPRRAWFVVNQEDLLSWRPEDAAAFARMLREECRLVKSFPLYVESRDLSVWVYLRE